MTDPSLRLPNTMFRAVLDLGDLPLDTPPLPARFAHPTLDADWDEEEELGVLYLGFADGQLHLEFTDEGVDFHFHHAADSGAESSDSPWPEADTTALLAWAAHLVAHVYPLLPDLIEDADEAATWHREGLTVYARDYGPVPLEIVDVEMEGEQLMLPWLGAGLVDHAHSDEPGNPILLLWNPEQDGIPDTPIARAWLDPKTGEPTSAGEPGTDWAAVGLPESEVLTWLETFYLNHEVIGDPAQTIVMAALARIAGLDGPSAAHS
ncbi:hypothetical protein [Cryobacterium tagatosivorans]|uniref:Uncharacterized protein n=1 Tax=Cryobacterium tagatosivorans TaxID=1259199 RepID=A0A4R8UFB1_9MICO|nr:hypothetical protein [Cryobacterium tagatosivorans]TFB52818.1 hypothetical protein E3O23_05835 [Cryobacterium tagatosivorans]